MWKPDRYITSAPEPWLHNDQLHRSGFRPTTTTTTLPLRRLLLPLLVLLVLRCCCYYYTSAATTPFEKSRAAMNHGMIMILSVRALMAYASRRFRPELKRIEEYGIGQANGSRALFLMQGQWCWWKLSNKILVSANIPLNWVQNLKKHLNKQRTECTV